MEGMPLWVLLINQLAPGGAVLAASLAAFFAWRGHERQKLVDRDDRFWKRMTWAIQHAGSGDVHDANVGMLVLLELESDDRIQQRERAMLATLVEHVYARVKGGSFWPEGLRAWSILRIPRRVRAVKLNE